MLGGRDAAPYRALLGNDRFRNLFWAMLTSSLGDWIGLFAILALTQSLLGTTRAGAFAVSGVMIARIVPTLLLGPVAGVFVDRWDRKRTLILTDIGRGAVMVFVALVGDVFQLIVATFAIEVMSALFIPAKDATLPNLVEREQLVEANQLSLMVTYGTLPLGALAFALFVGVSNTLFGDLEFLRDRPVAVPIWLNAVTFFASAAFVARIRFGAHRRGRRANADGAPHAAGAWQELREGFAFIATKPMIRALVIGVMAAFLAAGVVLAVGTYFATILNAGQSGFGVLGFVVGLGLFAGLTSARPLSQRLKIERLFAPGIGIAGGALIVTALMPRLDLAAIPALVMGAGAGLSFVTGYTLLQGRSGDEIRGRTFAAFNTGVRAALFASLVIGPALVGIIGLEQSQSAIIRGEEETVEELDEDQYYPYQVGGIRISLILAGLVAIGGGVWSGRAIHRVLSREELAAGEGAPPIGVEPEPERRLGRGVFVTFEGGEGAGKSTQMQALRQHLLDAGYDVLVTREPGGTPLGERIRDLLLDPGTDIGAHSEALLFAAARAQHAEDVIRPALARGTVVLCDRYIDSSVVYQGTGRGLGGRQVEQLSRWATGELLPDLVIVLDVPADVGMRRAGAMPDRMEQAGDDFHLQVNDAYRERAETDPDRYALIDASSDPDSVQAEVRAIIDEHLAGLAERPRSSRDVETTELDVSAAEERGS